MCRSLRNALLGADAGKLWRFAVLSSAHIGMPAQPERGLHRILEALGLRPACSASQQLDRLVASQAQHIRFVILRGGGWRLSDLQDVVAPLTGLCGVVILGMSCLREANCISAALARSSVASVRVEGSVAMCLPASVQDLELAGSIAMHDTTSEQQFSPLQLLAQLESLSIMLPRLHITEVHVKAWHPHLKKLRLTLHSSTGQNAATCLSRLQGVQLSLGVIACRTGGLAALMERLRSVQLYRMTLCCLIVDITPEVESLLAQCSITKQLCISWDAPADRRLQQVPRGAHVVYDRHSSSVADA